MLYCSGTKYIPKGDSSVKDMQVFKKGRVGNLEVRNRFVRSATGERLATGEGLVTAPLVDTIRELAQGGVGLIIPGHAFVDIESRSDTAQMGIHDDRTIPGLASLAEASHEYGAAIFAQLTFAGAKAALDGAILPLKGSSSFKDPRGVAVRAMSSDEIASMVEKFGAAASRAGKAGFDGVQIHLGHGYGLCQFVSPFLNRRTDEYGGSFENRSRIALEVYRAVRERVGGDFPVIAKMNCDDFIDGGTTPIEMIELARVLASEGLDGVEMSGGIGHPMARFGGARSHDPRDESEEGYHREAAKLFKSRISIPLILVGGIRSLDTSEKLLAEGTADFISMCRPFVREPALTARWQGGDTARAKCISCNACSAAAGEGNGIFCVAEAKMKQNNPYSQ